MILSEKDDAIKSLKNKAISLYFLVNAMVGPVGPWSLAGLVALSTALFSAPGQIQRVASMLALARAEKCALFRQVCQIAGCCGG